jgi:hypothetical protein
MTSDIKGIEVVIVEAHSRLNCVMHLRERGVFLMIKAGDR